MTRSIILVVAVLFSVCRADVTLGGCKTDPGYCPGQMISLTCDPDNENVTIGITTPGPNNIQLTKLFNNSIEIGETGTVFQHSNISIMYNKTSDTSFTVWTIAVAQMDGYAIQCIDGDDDTEFADCTIRVNTNPVPNPTNIGVEKRQYCDAVNITWSFASDADTSCVQELVRKVDDQEEDIPKDSTYFTVNDPYNTNSSDICVSVASKNYEDVPNEDFTGPQCVKFTAPLDPTGLSYDNRLASVTWDEPDLSRPGVLAYYFASKIADNDDNNDDDDDTSSGASGESQDGMDMGFKFIQVPGDQYMMQLQGAVVGNYYTVKLIAGNCYGNSSTVNYTFQVTEPRTDEPPTDPTTTEPTEEDTPEPSASPTMDDDEEFPTWAIAVIAVVGVLFLVCILLAICIPIICCCCFGTVICCAAAEAGSSKDMEMGRTGTHL